MGTVRKSLSKDGGICKKSTFNQDFFLYTLFFKEDSYSIAYKRSPGGSNIDSVFGLYSIISSKRIIDRIRQQDYSRVINSESGRIRAGRWNSQSYVYALVEAICLVSEKNLLSDTMALATKKASNWKPSQSIHSIFPFLEDRLPNSTHLLDTRIPYNLHSETLIRMFRRRIQDAPFLHFLRLLLSKYIDFYDTDRLLIPKLEVFKKLANMLWNYYIYEIESSLLFLRKQLRGSQSIPFVSTGLSNTIRKERHSDWYGDQQDAINNDYSPTRSLCIHYARYKNRSLVAVSGTRYFARKWICFILLLIESQFHLSNESNQVLVKISSRNCILLLGYTLDVQSIATKARVGTIGESYLSLFFAKKSFAKLPISSIVKLMAKENFCDSAGHPVSKSAWTTLPDDDILKRFIHVWRTLSLYYSGSINRDGLRRSKHILRFSCDKTLACKHKSTTRSLRRRFDSEVVSDNYSKSLYGKSPISDTHNNRLSNQRVWYLNITRPVISTLGVWERRLY
uniref:Maturase K n=1 Tax=Marsilea crenata TaxID=388472 RepID=S4UA29_MARCR|nr:intron maturase [Marsilea crenata]AGI51476.1 intron maturase [Marsilea crenata]